MTNSERIKELESKVAKLTKDLEEKGTTDVSELISKVERLESELSKVKSGNKELFKMIGNKGSKSPTGLDYEKKHKAKRITYDPNQPMTVKDALGNRVSKPMPRGPVPMGGRGELLEPVRYHKDGTVDTPGWQRSEVNGNYQMVAMSGEVVEEYDKEVIEKNFGF